jgi:hypothetical protein
VGWDCQDRACQILNSAKRAECVRNQHHLSVAQFRSPPGSSEVHGISPKSRFRLISGKIHLSLRRQAPPGNNSDLQLLLEAAHGSPPTLHHDGSRRKISPFIRPQAQGHASQDIRQFPAAFTETIQGPPSSLIDVPVFPAPPPSVNTMRPAHPHPEFAARFPVAPSPAHPLLHRFLETKLMPRASVSQPTRHPHRRQGPHHRGNAPRVASRVTRNDWANRAFK